MGATKQFQMEEAERERAEEEAAHEAQNPELDLDSQEAFEHALEKND